MQSLDKIKSGLLFLVFCSCSLSPASAEVKQDYCIKCINPDQTYICRVGLGNAASRGNQFLCIVNIAKEHGHDSCAALAHSVACSGLLVQYEASGTAAAEHDTASDRAVETIPTTTPPDTLKTPPKEPKTLVEFTKQASKATKNSVNTAGREAGEAIQKTSNTIKDFANNVGRNLNKATKNTLQCITTLFQKCGGD